MTKDDQAKTTKRGGPPIFFLLCLHFSFTLASLSLTDIHIFFIFLLKNLKLGTGLKDGNSAMTSKILVCQCLTRRCRQDFGSINIFWQDGKIIIEQDRQDSQDSQDSQHVEILDNSVDFTLADTLKHLGYTGNDIALTPHGLFHPDLNKLADQNGCNQRTLDTPVRILRNMQAFLQ